MRGTLVHPELRDGKILHLCFPSCNSFTVAKYTLREMYPLNHFKGTIQRHSVYSLPSSRTSSVPHNKNPYPLSSQSPAPHRTPTNYSHRCALCLPGFAGSAHTPQEESLQHVAVGIWLPGSSTWWRVSVPHSPFIAE